MTTIKIGPVHGVQPIENAIPIRNEPRRPAGRFLKVNVFVFDKNEKFNTPTMTKPKNTIKIAPTWRIKCWFFNRKSAMNVVLKPIMINTAEKPSKKKIVCNKLFDASFLFSSFNSLTLIPVM